jgi:hypothetical protein
MERVNKSNSSVARYKIVEEKAIKVSGDFVIRRYQ